MFQCFLLCAIEISGFWFSRFIKWHRSELTEVGKIDVSDSDSQPNPTRNATGQILQTVPVATLTFQTVPRRPSTEPSWRTIPLNHLHGSDLRRGWEDDDLQTPSVYRPNYRNDNLPHTNSTFQPHLGDTPNESAIPPIGVSIRPQPNCTPQ